MSWIKTFGVFLLLQVPVLIGAAWDGTSYVFLLPAGTVVAVLYVAYLIATGQPIRNFKRFEETASAAAVATVIGFAAEYIKEELPQASYATNTSGDGSVTAILYVFFCVVTVILMMTVFHLHYLLSRGERQPD